MTTAQAPPRPVGPPPPRLSADRGVPQQQQHPSHSHNPSHSHSHSHSSHNPPQHPPNPNMHPHGVPQQQQQQQVQGGHQPPPHHHMQGHQAPRWIRTSGRRSIGSAHMALGLATAAAAAQQQRHDGGDFSNHENPGLGVGGVVNYNPHAAYQQHPHAAAAAAASAAHSRHQQMNGMGGGRNPSQPSPVAQNGGGGAPRGNFRSASHAVNHTGAYPHPHHSRNQQAAAVAADGFQNQHNPHNGGRKPQPSQHQQGGPNSHHNPPHGPPPGHYVNHVNHQQRHSQPSPQTQYTRAGVPPNAAGGGGRQPQPGYSNPPPQQRSQSMMAPSTRPQVDLRTIDSHQGQGHTPTSDMSGGYYEDGGDSDEELEIKSTQLPPYLKRPPTPPRARYGDTEEEPEEFDIYEQNTQGQGPKKRVHFGRTRIKSDRKTSPKNETTKTLSPADIKNLIGKPKLIQMTGLTQEAFDRLVAEQHNTDKNGCLPGSVLSKKSGDNKVVVGYTKKDGSPVTSILAQKEISIHQVRYNQFLPSRHAYEKEYVSLIAKGSWVTKYNQRGKATKRWFSLSSDHSELLWASGKRNLKRRKRVNLTDLIDIIPGKGFPRFAYATVPSWLCVTLIFTTRHMHISFANIDLYMAWFLGLQSLAPMSQCDMTRGMLIWYRAIWKLDDDAAGIPRDPAVWNYPASLRDGDSNASPRRGFGGRRNRQQGTI